MDEITLIVVIEDKMQEQENALNAIVQALVKDGDEECCRLDIGSGAAQVAYKESKVMVLFASDLTAARRRISLAVEFEEVVPHRVVITDLMFPSDKGGREEPNGLGVLAYCIRQDLPVVVCSDTNHHDVGYLRDVFPLLGNMHAKGEIPVILDKKDWDRAVVEALRLIDVCTEHEVAV